ncbi:hypothetical protein TNCV_817991 [Trichonephila clavipes]|nr:hypothetical protein TNCV_817991 [Trichonephila clavipes]
MPYLEKTEFSQRFPYINLIEHVWDALGNTIATRQLSSRILLGLRSLGGGVGLTVPKSHKQLRKQYEGAYIMIVNKYVRILPRDVGGREGRLAMSKILFYLQHKQQRKLDPSKLIDAPNLSNMKTNNQVHARVNGDRYRAMITNFFIPELNNHDVQELWFQQDGATCHTARATIDLLKDTFGDRLISRFGPVNWPPRSCDLTPLDYFLWGYVKSLVYADKPQTLDHLEDNIRRVIADIRPQMLEKVIENWTSRLDYIRASPVPEIIFKM